MTEKEVLEELSKEEYYNEEYGFCKRLKHLNPKLEIWVCFYYDKNFDFGNIPFFENGKLQKETVLRLIWSHSSFKDLFQYEGSILSKQIEKFRAGRSTAFIYDFNHDGNDEILSFMDSTSPPSAIINSISFFGEFLYDFSIIITKTGEIWSFSPFEFINYKNRQGLKFWRRDFLELKDLGNGVEKPIYTDYHWAFYHYDRIQRKYVRDESASPEELEQIHGSPDFFAEAGIDYTKLERPLAPADLEGFSKAALRIWRNAVYARHGRRFASEDLQALFNEYAWYKADEEYSDDKLTDTDRANIKLIQEYEKK